MCKNYTKTEVCHVSSVLFRMSFCSVFPDFRIIMIFGKSFYPQPIISASSAYPQRIIRYIKMKAKRLIPYPNDYFAVPCPSADRVIRYRSKISTALRVISSSRSKRGKKPSSPKMLRTI